MTREEIVEKLEPIAQKVFSQPGLKISDDMSASTLQSWTSLSFTQMLTRIEEEFGFKFKMMEILKMQNMGAIIETISKHVG